MIHIILFGTGCDLCREIASRIETAIPLSGCDVRFEKSADLHRMLSCGVKSTPSLLLEGEIVSEPAEMGVEEITALIKSSCAKIKDA